MADDAYMLTGAAVRKTAASANITRRLPRRARGLIIPPERGEQYPREIEWINGYSDACPPGGVIKIYDDEADANNATWRLYGTQPDDERGNFYAINGSSSVAAGDMGVCLLHGHALAKLPDTVAQGDTVYCKTDSWDAADNGIFAIGEVLGSSVTLQVNDSGTSAGLKPILLTGPETHLIGKPGSTVTKGSSGSFTIWNKSSGSWAATTATITADALGAECASGKYAKLEKISGAWVAGPMECA